MAKEKKLSTMDASKDPVIKNIKEANKKNEGFESDVDFLKIDKAREYAKPLLKRYEKAKQGAGNRVDDHQELMAFYEGKQYNLRSYSSDRPWVVRMNTPYSKVAIDTRVASLIAENYKGALFPLREEDRETVEALAKVLDNEWDRMDLDTYIDSTIHKAAIIREGYLHFNWATHGVKNKFNDDRKGYIEVQEIINPSSVYIDPNALSLETAQYISIPVRMSADEVLTRFPEWKKVIDPGTGGHSYEDRGETSVGNKDPQKIGEEFYTVITHYEKYKGYIVRYTILEDAVIDKKELKGHTRFPIAQFKWQAEHSSPYGLSLMDDLIGLQKAINAIESAITQTAVGYSAPSFAIRKGSGINAQVFSEFIGAPGFAVTVNGDPKTAFAPIALPTLDQSIAQIKNEYVNAIDAIAGISSQYLGSIGTAGNTAQGAELAIERARIIEASVLSNISSFVEQITRIMVEFLASQYSNKELSLRNIDKRQGVSKFVPVEVPEIEEGFEYTYYINLDKKTKYSRERQREMIENLYEMQIQYDDAIKLVNQKDIINEYDLENKEELATRYDLMTEEMLGQKAELILQLQQQVEQLEVGEELLPEAIVEIMADKKATPILDQLVEMIQQSAMEFQQQVQGDLQEVEQVAEEAGLDINEVLAQSGMADQLGELDDVEDMEELEAMM